MLCCSQRFLLAEATALAHQTADFPLSSFSCATMFSLNAWVDHTPCHEMPDRTAGSVVPLYFPAHQ